MFIEFRCSFEPRIMFLVSIVVLMFASCFEFVCCSDYWLRGSDVFLKKVTWFELLLMTVFG